MYYTDEKLYPPQVYSEDFPLDVASVQLMKCLDENIARFAGCHSQSQYPLTSAGVAGNTVTTLSTQKQYLATIAHKAPVLGNKCRVWFLAGVTAAGHSFVNIYLCDGDSIPYVYNTDTAQAAINSSVESEYVSDFTVSAPRWYYGEFDIGTLRTVSIFATVHTDGTTTGTTIYASHVEMESDNV